MPKRTPTGGRPSKGERVKVVSRVTPEVAAAIRDEAERLDLPYSDVMAHILTTHYGYPAVIKQPQVAEQMRLSA